MSRIGKIPITVPKEVKVAINKGTIELEGPKGKLTLAIPSGITVEHQDNSLVVNRSSNTKQNRANHGTVRANMANIIEGVTNGHKRDLEIQGIGFRAQVDGKKIVFNLGFSHPIEFPVPEDIIISLPTQTTISVGGVDKFRVGQIAAKIRDLKPAEPYKGKGIRYAGEIIKRKQGKSITK